MEYKEEEGIVFSVFKEHPIVDYRLEEPNVFDISAQGLKGEPDFRKNNVFDYQAYCISLIEKLLSVKLPECRSFLEYQCQKVKEPSNWLKQVEELIDQNHTVFSKESCRYAKLMVITEALGEKYQADNKATPLFDFNKTKARIDKLDSDQQKLQVLHDERINFLQYNTHNINALHDSFVKKVELEMDRITGNQALNGQPKSQKTVQTFSEKPPKLKIKSNTNIIVDVFYQLMRQLDNNKQPYIEGSIREVAEAICTVFIDKNGEELVQSTVETILSPSKNDKRPNGEKQLKFIII